ncbi:hypothetical protein FBEOM_2399 [Fusarium beomiforme]|uniref:Uncharacterized protein n=1 Tax=Fusarium beomiforme TaxID=44412 RepID=A0A9P5ARY7_9HYPO|nr:hypothetical protein FBEOM_2399 [Fusarium beomiforme]
MTPQSVEQRSRSQTSRQNVNKSGAERPQTPSQNRREVNDCLGQLERHENITEANMDYMLSLFSEDTRIKVLRADAVDLSMPHYCIPTDERSFIAPVCHKRDENIWSVVFITSSRASFSSPLAIKAVHYEPITSKDRHQELHEKIKWWVGQRFGADVTLKYTSAGGPRTKENCLSGVFAIMGAREFGQHGTIKSRTQDWSGDPVRCLKNALKGRRLKSPAPPTPGSSGLRHRPSLEREGSDADRVGTPTRRGKSKTPGGGKSGKGRSRYTDVNNTFVTAITPNPAIADTNSGPKPPQHSSIQLSQDSIEVVPVPNSKRRRPEQTDPLAFNVKETLEQHKTFATSQGIPQIAILHQETKKCRADCADHNRIVDWKKEDMSKCHGERALRAEEHERIEEAWNTLGAKIAQGEKLYLEDYLPKVTAKLSTIVPAPPIDLLEEDPPRPPEELMRKDFEAKMKPFKEEHEQTGARKRKASDMLQSANKTCSMLEEELRQAEKEGEERAKKMREASDREELAAMLERQEKEREAFKARLEENNRDHNFQER